MNDAPTDQKKFPTAFPPPAFKTTAGWRRFFFSTAQPADLSLKNSKENRKR